MVPGVTELLKVKHPFIQAPMLGVTTPEMVAAASNQDCFGSLPLGMTGREKATELISKVKNLTNKPFGVNLFAYEAPVVKEYDISVLESFYAKHNLPFNNSIPTLDPYPPYTDLIDIIIEEQIPVVSFTFGIPANNVIDRLRDNNVILIGTATSALEAKMIEDAGLHMVVAQGIEAGGHRGSFLKEELPQIGLISLLPQVIDAVKIPVVAAGGLAQAPSCAAAFVLGAKAVQIGSLFLRSPESSASQSHKDAVAVATGESTVLTRAWTGRFARGINNDFIRQFGSIEPLPYPIQNILTQPLRQYGIKQQLTDLQSMWAGQSAHLAQEKPTEEILRDLVHKTYDTLSTISAAAFVHSKGSSSFY